MGSTSQCYVSILYVCFRAPISYFFPVVVTAGGLLPALANLETGFRVPVGAIGDIGKRYDKLGLYVSSGKVSRKNACAVRGRKWKFYLWEIAGCIIKNGGKIEAPQDTLTGKS
jgi:hypothetical protein